jgi:hypothetical protein
MFVVNLACCDVMWRNVHNPHLSQVTTRGQYNRRISQESGKAKLSRHEDWRSVTQGETLHAWVWPTARVFRHTAQNDCSHHLRLRSKVRQREKRTVVVVNGRSRVFRAIGSSNFSQFILLGQHYAKIRPREAVTGDCNIQERRTFARDSCTARARPHGVNSAAVRFSFLCVGQWEESMSVVAFEPEAVASPLPHLRRGVRYTTK